MTILHLRRDAMQVDPFQVLGVEPGCDYAAITSAHSERCRRNPEMRALFDQALVELISAAQAKATAAETPIDVIPMPEPSTDRRKKRASGRRKSQASPSHLEPTRPPTLEAVPAEPPPQRRRLEPEEGEEPAKALAALNRRLARQPTAEAHYRRGRLYARLAEGKKAIADYTQALALDATLVEAYFGRGAAYHGLNELRKALADFSKAIEHDPAFIPAYLQRGKVYADLGHPQRGVADYDQALRLDPENAEAYTHRGWLYHQLGQKQQALSDYSQAIDLDPRHAQAYYNRGKLYVEMGESKKARQDLNRAIEVQGQGS